MAGFRTAAISCRSQDCYSLDLTPLAFGRGHAYVLFMIPSVSSLMSSPPAPAPPTVSAKPWAPGDPSSFQQLFSPISTAPAVKGSPAAAAPVPTAPGNPSSFQQLFASSSGASALTTDPAPIATPAVPLVPFTFEQNAAVTGYGTSTPMNPEELATADTADRLAKMLGGKVEQQPDYTGGWSTSAPTRDITFADSKVTLNAGITAYLFNTYGDAPGSQAWQQVNQLLGRNPMSTTTTTTTT
jgi:hypothetical protein